MPANSHPLIHGILITLVTGLMLCFPCRALADGQFHFIVGYVRDTAGNPIVGLDVAGDDYVGDILQSWPTDTNGFYKIDAQTDGNYRVAINCQTLAALGYRCVDPVAVSVAAELTDLNFTLEKTGATVLQITNTALPRGNAGVPYQVTLGASGGQPPYQWKLTVDSPALPPNLSLLTNGIISGTPTNSFSSNIKVQVLDSKTAKAEVIFPLTINRSPVLSVPNIQSNRFSMRLTGAANQNYTLQYSTNLNSTNWTLLAVTNNPNASSYVVTDPNPLQGQKFYRVLIGP